MIAPPGKFEAIGALGVSLLLLGTGAIIGVHSYHTIQAAATEPPLMVPSHRCLLRLRVATSLFARRRRPWWQRRP